MNTILGIAGSLREGSYNRALLRACTELLPAGWELSIYERLAEIPPYNEDVRERANPEVVRDLKERIRRADALLVITPEYNYGIPGVLKNAIDWASRADGDTPTPLLRKPCAIAGAGPGNFGTIRAQLALRQTFLFTETDVVRKPEVHVFKAAERFDGDMRLMDEGTRSLMRQLLEALVAKVEANVAPVR